MRKEVFKLVLVTVLCLGGRALGTDVGGLISTDTTWTLAGSPYVVTGSSGIVIGLNATLTIEPGVVVKFNPQLAIAVGSNAFGKGTLVARGTNESPIIFTSVKDPCDPCNPAKPGDWSRIHFTDYASDVVFDMNDNYQSGCILEHVVIEYAGYGNYGAIFAEKSSPFLNFCEVCHNSYYGIQVDGSNAPRIIIINSEVWDHPQLGIYISGGSGHRLINNNIHDNRSGGISFSGSGSNTLIGNTITGNTGGGIYFSWYSGSNTLTGNTITDNTSNSSGGGICFSYGSGGNTLTGNTITANTSGGSGGGLCFGGTYGSGGNTLTGNTVSGNTSGGSGGGICFVGDISGSGGNTLTGNTISDNTGNAAGGGIYFGSSGSNILTLNVIQSNISKNGFGVVHLYASSDTVFSQNTITDNYIETGTTGGIYVTGNSERVSLASDPNKGTYNIICNNAGYWVFNDNNFNADGRNDVNAVYVQWGTCDMQEIMARIFDYFDDGSKAFVMFYPIVCAGDFDFDQDVDLLDLETFVENWLRQDCAIPDWCEGTDLDLSTNVDFVDFAYFADNWLFGVGP